MEITTKWLCLSQRVQNDPFLETVWGRSGWEILVRTNIPKSFIAGRIFLQFKKQICNDVPKVGLLLGQIEVVLMSYLTLFNCNVDGSLHPFRWSLEAAKNDNKGKETKSATAKHVTCWSDTGCWGMSWVTVRDSDAVWCSTSTQWPC